MSSQPRHELKYAITRGDYLALRRRLLPVLQHDRYADTQGQYAVHSLYFDNYDDKALREKLEGKCVREKFRIRYYNNDLTHIKLEKKSKNHGMGIKQSAPLQPDQVRMLLRGHHDWMCHSEHALIYELGIKMNVQGLRPRTTVDYIREPFYYAPGNVRITFDQWIGTAQADSSFLQPHATTPATNNAIVMEIKFDRYLPELISGLLELGTYRARAFSKYAACRMIY